MAWYSTPPHTDFHRIRRKSAFHLACYTLLLRLAIVFFSGLLKDMEYSRIRSSFNTTSENLILSVIRTLILFKPYGLTLLRLRRLLWA